MRDPFVWGRRSLIKILILFVTGVFVDEIYFFDKIFNNFLNTVEVITPIPFIGTFWNLAACMTLPNAELIYPKIRASHRYWSPVVHRLTPVSYTHLSGHGSNSYAR